MSKTSETHLVLFLTCLLYNFIGKIGCLLILVAVEKLVVCLPD
jgi:hypothetical protein